MKHRYNVQQVQEAVSVSNSIRNVLKLLNIVPAGGNYYIIKKFIKNNNIDISHFTGRGHNLGKFLPRIDTKEYLSNRKSITSHKLRLRLIKENIFENRCSICDNSTWLDKPIPLELHHKDGKHSNNSLNNLFLVCPNCHAFTSTYRGKNKK
jgi:hypothetical protein